VVELPPAALYPEFALAAPTPHAVPVHVA
jgi:hypothetical protein